MNSLAISLVRIHAWKLAVIGTAMAAVFAFTLTAAQASGDPYGDGTGSDAGVDGDIADATGAPDNEYVEVGTDAEDGGFLTVNFSNNIAFDGPGDDIRVHAEPAGDPASAVIDVSADGTTWISAGAFADTADADIDLGSLGLSFAAFVRVTYDSGEFPGYNLDAVETLNGLGEDTILDASPETAENPGHTDHTVTAEVTDDGTGIEGVPVSFAVTAGPNDGEDATESTDVDGEAEFTYTGNGGAGEDNIVAWLDLDGDGNVDPGEPSDEVTKDWLGYTGTIDLDDVDGGGLEVGDTVLVTVVDADLDTTGAEDTVDVQVASSSDGTGFTLELEETGTSTGVFQGSFTIEDATDAGDLELEAEDGDTVVGLYDDELDADGDDPTAVSDTLTVVATEDDEVDEEESEGEHVTICHMPPGNPGNAQTITVGADAEAAHLAHGDTLGDCDEEELPPTRQEQQREAFCDARPDHPRCGDVASADLEAEDNEDEDEQRGRRPAIANAMQQAQLEAFCERKGDDHPRCDALEQDDKDED